MCDLSVGILNMFVVSKITVPLNVAYIIYQFQNVSTHVPVYKSEQQPLALDYPYDNSFFFGFRVKQTARLGNI